MPVIEGFPGECLVKIFTDPEAGFRIAGTDGERVVLEKGGIDGAIILRSSERYHHIEVEDWLAMSEIGWVLFTNLKSKYCPE